jgi:hypothetical protein
LNKVSLAKLMFLGFIAVSLTAAVFAVDASAQIKIGNVTIGKPKPDSKVPTTTTKPPNPTTSNPTGTSTSSASSSNRQPTTSKVETGATRDQVSEFNKDIAPYRNGMNYLKWWSTSTNSITSGCGTLTSLREALTAGAAFHEIIKQKYPGIENPSWSNGNAEHHQVGDYRRAAENRVEIVKKCVNGLMDARLTTEIASIESAISEFDKREGYVLRADSFNKAAQHAALMERWKEHYAEVGLTMPDESVFTAYDAAHERLVAVAVQNAGKWVFPPTFHDAMIETKARGWLKDRNPKATVVKIGMLHGEWQVNKHSNGLPSGRYKRGYVMFRLPSFQNCLVTSFALEQNYIGGGRFNAEAITSGMQHSLRAQTCK